jgi:bifunctional non-homologous end joining protein LigD
VLRQKTKAQFIEPMLLVRSDTLPEGPNWAYELKLDGYRALAIKSYGVAHLRSRNNKGFDSKYPAIVQPSNPLSGGSVAPSPTCQTRL